MKQIIHTIRMRHGLTWGVRTGQLAEAFKNALFAIVFLLALLAVYGWMGERDMADRERTSRDDNTAYTRALEKVVAACMDTAGKPVAVGGEWFLCGITPTGERL